MWRVEEHIVEKIRNITQELENVTFLSKQRKKKLIEEIKKLSKQLDTLRIILNEKNKEN